MDIRDGPLRDIRDCLGWVYADDGLEGFLASQGGSLGNYGVDRERVMGLYIATSYLDPWCPGISKWKSLVAQRQWNVGLGLKNTWPHKGIIRQRPA